MENAWMGISLEYLRRAQDWLGWCNDQRDKESDNCLIICSQAQWLSDHWPQAGIADRLDQFKGNKPSGQFSAIPLSPSVN